MRFPGFIGPSYTSPSVNVDAQRCVNLYLERNPLGTGKEGEPMSLVPTPGLTRLVTLPTYPTRALWRDSDGTLFAVGGAKAYRISSAWVATELGTLNTSTGPVSIADNGDDVIFSDGTNGFIWKISTSTWTQITDVDFLGAGQVTYLDGYFIFNVPATGRFFISGLNATTFDALDVSTAESSPDDLVGLTMSNQKLVLFGAQSTEVYYNSGDAGFPFNRIQGAAIDVGCIAAGSIAKLQDNIYWVGGDSTGSGIVYRSEGYKPVRISTPAIEGVIRGLTTTQLTAATAYVYQQGGHTFYCLNLPGTLSTWVYDASTGLWHERVYLNLWSLERHRAECHAVAYGKNVVGDYQNGKIYALDPASYKDDATSIVRIRSSPHLSSGLRFARHNSFQLDMETGVGLDGTGQGTAPQAALRWSDDGGHTWSNEQWADIGAIGRFKTRAVWRRLGSSRDRIYEVRITDPVKVVLIGAEISVEEGAA